MRRALPLSCAVLLLLAACAAPPPSSDAIAEREALVAAVDRLWDAYAREDLDTMERLLDEEAVQVGERRIEGRAAILAFLRRWFDGLQIVGWGYSQRSVRLIGDVALVSFWQEETGLAGGEPYRVEGWVSNVWVRRPQGWLNAVTHFGANQALPPEEIPPP